MCNNYFRHKILIQSGDMQVFIIIHTAVNILEQCTQDNVIVRMIQGQTMYVFTHVW